MKNIAYIDHRFREILSAITILDLLLSEKDIESKNKHKIKTTRDLLNNMLNETNYFIQKIVSQEEEIFQMKNEFSTHINHELKNPITSIIGTSDFLLHYHDNLTKEDFIPRVERIKTSSEDLLELVQDLLNLSKLESGCYPYHLDHINLEKIIIHLEKNFFSLFQDKKIEFKITLKSHKNFNTFINDSNHIYQILSNLLSNALKFTEQGKVSLLIHSQNNKIIFSVKDTGIGIPKKKIQTLTNNLNTQKAENQPTNEGIGLYIVKQLTKIHGGELVIKSQLQKGSRIIVALPLTSKLYNQ